MFKKILIANRGEIACRIIKTCKDLGIKTVAVYSDIDKNALHVKLADEAYLLGAAPAKESYLRIDKIIEAAKATGAEAIHPGYGFLSENNEFNKQVRAAGLIFIGPEPEPMRSLGSKIESRHTMVGAGIPVIPGFIIKGLQFAEIKSGAEEIGLPVLIKASAGGGGKGMRVVRDIASLQESIDSAKREALSAFGDDSVFVEKYIDNPRHIEVQVAADKHRNVIHLFERECSLQRRHQKIVEETPSQALTPELRAAICQTAVEVIKTVNYDSLATVEFLLDENGKYYFLEVNTRIQVEHPITEMITNLDLVKIQLEIAYGLPLSSQQSDITSSGHSIECRIYAEDGENNFMPSAGKLHLFAEPQGNNVRLDTGVKTGDEISIYYDPMIAKLIVWAKDRETARMEMLKALKNTAVQGVKNSLELLMNILESNEYITAETYTNTIEKKLSEFAQKRNKFITSALASATLVNNKAVANITLGNTTQKYDPWKNLGSWEIGQ